MKVAIVSAVFPPEPMVSAQTSVQIAEELSRLGHSVSVLAPFPNRPQGSLYQGYARRLYSTQHLGARYFLTYCFATFSPDSTMISRFAENLSFGFTSGLRLLFGERPDVVYSNSWAIFATGIMAIVTKLRRIPFVLSVQDVYPESLKSQGRTTKHGSLYRLLLKCDQAIARSAAEVIVISPRFRDLYEKERGVDQRRLHVIPNWGRDDHYQNDTAAGLAFRQKLHIPEDSFVAVYAGNVGVASNAEMLISVFAMLKQHSRMYLVIAGDGSRLGACRKEVEVHNLDRVLFHSPWRVEETGAVLQMADVLLLPTKGEQSLISIPSKLIGYLLSGRPIIAGVLPESDTGIAVLGCAAGWVVAPDSADQMAQAIVTASEQSIESLNQMGSAGRQYALQNLVRGSSLPRVIEIVERAAGLQNREDETQRRVNLCQ